MTEDFWASARNALERVQANPPDIKALARRARTLRSRRYAVAGLALIVVGAGVFFPLRLLSRLGEAPETDRIGPGASSNTPPSVEESHSFRPDWFAHVDTEDRVRIEAPRDWVYRNDPTNSLDPGVLFALGSWNVPAYWEGEPCGYDTVLSFLPEVSVLVWLEEIRSASLSKDFVSLETSPRLRDLVLGGSQCVPQRQVHQLGFHLDGRDFLLFVAFGEKTPNSLRATVDDVLASFRTRIDEEPFPPEPTGPVIEVATGTAFGGTWSLSAYWTDYQDESVVCYRILGAGSGCADPKAAAPEGGSYFQSFNFSGNEGYGVPSETFAYGVVWKEVAGITLTLDDGRVLSSETLRTKAFPLAFYVIPFEGRAEQVVSMEALDAEGNVLEESTFGM